MLGWTDTRFRSWEEVTSMDTNMLRHLPRRSNNNCDLQFANCDRQTIQSFQKVSSILTFPIIAVCWPPWPGSGQTLVIDAKVEIWRRCRIRYFSCSKCFLARNHLSARDLGKRSKWSLLTSDLTRIIQNYKVTKAHACIDLLCRT